MTCAEISPLKTKNRKPAQIIKEPLLFTWENENHKKLSFLTFP